jgi:hypothetical protein
MTCDDLRERLLEGELADPDLTQHLSRCAACGELAAALVRAESDLRQHLEDFVNAPTLDAQWAKALDRARPMPRWGSRVQRAVLIAAAVAALAVVAVPLLPPPSGEGPGGALGVGMVPPAVQEARDRVQAFHDVDTEHLGTEGLPQTEENARLTDALQRKAAALTHAEAALVAAASDGEPTWRATAFGELGDLYAAMGDTLEEFPQPSYLTDGQRVLYALAIGDKVWVQRQKALDTYAAGAGFAQEHGLVDLATEIQGRATALRRVMAAGAAASVRSSLASGCLDAPTTERGRQLIAEIEAGGVAKLAEWAVIAEKLEDEAGRCR